MEHLYDETEFRRFIKTIGPWFEGVAKFVAIMARHNDDIYTGERLMLQKLERETFKIDKYMKELRNRFKVEDGLVTESCLHDAVIIGFRLPVSVVRVPGNTPYLK